MATSKPDRLKPGSEHYWFDLDRGGDVARPWTRSRRWRREEDINDLMERFGWDRARAEAAQDHPELLPPAR